MKRGEVWWADLPAKALLARRVSLLSQARMEAIGVAIRFALDLA